MKDYLRKFLSLPLQTIIIICIGILFWVFAVIVWPFAWNSRDLGKTYGEIVGSGVGTAIGSYNGLTDGFEKGKEDGKAKALDSNDDIESEIENSVQEIGKLEVLVAGFSVQNFHEIGDEYASLEILKGNAVYSIDLATATTSYSRDGSEVTIKLDEPEIDLFINENETKQLAEYQKYPWSGSAEDGYKAYLNSRANSYEEIKGTMENYDQLLKSAKESAIKEVTRLADAVCKYSDKDHVRTVTVVFKRGY